MKRAVGHYDDAIYKKRSRVCCFLVEALGGISRQGRKQLGVLAERTKGKHATDRTKYGSARDSPRSYYTHHTQQISKAAVVYDAMAIRKALLHQRQRLCVSHSAANAASASGVA